MTPGRAQKLAVCRYMASAILVSPKNKKHQIKETEAPGRRGSSKITKEIANIQITGQGDRSVHKALTTQA